MRLRRLAMGASLLGFVACGASTEGPVVANQPPKVTFSFEKLAVRKGVNVNLTVSVSDPNEDDALSVTWEISRNTLTPMNSARTVMEWQTPATTGADTVRVTVSDGELSSMIEEIIWVGTNQTENSRSNYVIADSPYIVALGAGNPKLSIPPDFTATVDPGVMILMDEPLSEIVVEGTLVINGTALDPVLIKPNRRSPFVTCGGNGNWWEGIRVSTGNPASPGSLEMTHGEVRNGTFAVRLTETASAVITSSALRCSQTAAVRIAGSGALTITDCDIDNNNGGGVHLITGLTITPPASVNITDSRIRINGGVGIDIDIDDQNGSVPINILRNEISSNITYGIRLLKAAKPTINFNSFFANGNPPGEYNILLTTGFPLGGNITTIDATQNFWGAAYSTQTPIDATVWDSIDSPAVATRLLLSPWLSAAP